MKDRLPATTPSCRMTEPMEEKRGFCPCMHIDEGECRGHKYLSTSSVAADLPEKKGCPMPLPFAYFKISGYSERKEGKINEEVEKKKETKEKKVLAKAHHMLATFPWQKGPWPIPEKVIFVLFD